MGHFKQWLFNEDIAESPDAFGDLFYPTDAGDYAYASSDPSEHWWLQWKWWQEKRHGRKFHNIDQKEFEKRNYTSIKSLDMPDLSDKSWRHKEVDNPSVEVETDVEMGARKWGKNAKENKLQVYRPMRGIVLPLDQIFGDKPSGKYPQAASTDRWRK